jgi:hypothetical protein
MSRVLQEVFQETFVIDSSRVSGLCLRLFTRRGPVWSVRRSGPNRLDVIKVTWPETGFPDRDLINRHPYLSSYFLQTRSVYTLTLRLKPGLYSELYI